MATVRGLGARRVAHGDLQHDNILIRRDGRFQLIDYDGMFVPAMRDLELQASEVGRPAYQHPERGGPPSNLDHFDERLDDFAALVILLSLAAVNAELWDEYHDDENLIIGAFDLRAPRESPVLTELAMRPPPVGALARLVSSRSPRGASKTYRGSRQCSPTPRSPRRSAWMRRGGGPKPPLRGPSRRVARLMRAGRLGRRWPPRPDAAHPLVASGLASSPRGCCPSSPTAASRSALSPQRSPHESWRSPGSSATARRQPRSPEPSACRPVQSRVTSPRCDGSPAVPRPRPSPNGPARSSPRSGRTRTRQHFSRPAKPS